MRTETLDTDVLLFRGESVESIAAAFFDGQDALLVDTLASEDEARQMHDHLSYRLGKRVRRIVLTHFMDDHTAGLPVFQGAEVIAHRWFSDTFHRAKERPRADFDRFVAPDVVFDDTLSIRHGRHHLELFHNPGKTMCSIGIEVPSSDLLFTADNLLGQIVFISGASPELLHDSMDRLARKGGARLVQGHQGVYGRESLAWGRHYLSALEAAVRSALGGENPEQAVAAIQVDPCLASGLAATTFEREWHARNLEIITARRLFRVGSHYSVAEPASAYAGNGLTGWLRRSISPAAP